MKDLPPYYYVLIAGLIAGALIYFKKRSNYYLIGLTIFLLVTLIVELIGRKINLQHNSRRDTTVLYNWFTSFEFTFYIWLLREVANKKLAKRVFLYILLAYPLAAAYNILFAQGTHGFHTVTYAIGCLLVVPMSIYYFFELFLGAKSARLLTQPAFWICSGLLFFYCCSFLIFGLSNFVKSLPRVIVLNLQDIISWMNAFLYSMFTIAFLCRIKIKKSSQS